MEEKLKGVQVLDLKRIVFLVLEAIGDWLTPFLTVMQGLEDLEPLQTIVVFGLVVPLQSVQIQVFARFALRARVLPLPDLSNLLGAKLESVPCIILPVVEE